ncbi:PCNA protein [Haloarcula sinaiiensis tailed virus 1]|uniref:PCNA protein n=1 Tax=Haloarcula sinaiiensis tailed virus 1 TaxID=1262530 RepID=R9QTN4_9CAUD|nr:PCNA protein [Haloarcula sinaiiensis tailed virus 1]AGC34585.1 PCNA protein [Haloarcula sinaiiensis tailed virus 1]
MSDDTVLETIVPAGELQTTLDILRSLVQEAILHIGKDGIRTAVVEPGNVCMYSPVKLGPSAFESVPSGSFALGINLESLEDSLHRAAPDTPVSLSFDTEKRRLRVQYDRVDMDLACIDPDSIRDEPDNPDPGLPNHFAVSTDDLEAAVDTVELVTDHLDVHVDDDAVRFRGKGDTDTAEYQLLEDELYQPDLNEETMSIFSMEFMQSLIGAVPNGTDEVQIHVGDEFPILMEYEYADGAGYAEAMLAPRIQNR